MTEEGVEIVEGAPETSENVEMPLSVQYEYEYSDSSEIDVTFTKDDITHTRSVNNTGDSETFEVRVKEVAMGVENKINIGVFVNNQPDEVK